LLLIRPNMSDVNVRGPEPASRLPQQSVFWGEIAPAEHFVQIYKDDGVFLDTLEGFVAGGLRSGDAVILIGTSEHLRALEQRLLTQDIDVAAARERDQYIARSADETLNRFMVGAWPDDARFNAVVSDLLARARGGQGRRVRAFGEMVALLWARGNEGATVRLEHLWHGLCRSEAFSLFCAYPRVGFTQDAASSISELCAAHSKVIDG
jgi:hypothetical protein